jgi:hypothetical protein
MGFKSVKDKFADVKKKLQSQEDAKSTDYGDSQFFKPQPVKGEAKSKFRIRILDLGEESQTGLPWLQFNYHMFKRQGDSKYIKVIDPKTFDKSAPNPIAELASKLFSSDNALDNTMAKTLYRKPRYFCKVYVKEAPENQAHYIGKVLILEASKTLYDKFIDEIEETDDDETPFYDPFEGKDFSLIVKQKGEWPDYSDSKFMSSRGPIMDDEDVMDKIYKESVAMKVKDVILKRDPVKSYKELESLLKGGLEGGDVDTSTTDLVSGKEIENTDLESIDEEEEKPKSKPKDKAKAKPESKPAG